VDHSPIPAALDLASGELVVLPKENSPEALAILGKGDVAFGGISMGVPFLAFIRGASPDAPDGSVPDSHVGHIPFKVVSGPWPKTFTVRAADGKPYTVTVLRADAQSCELEYSPVTATPGGAVQNGPMAEAQAELKVAASQRDASEARLKSLEKSAADGRATQEELDAARKEFADAQDRITAAAGKVGAIAKEASQPQSVEGEPAQTAKDFLRAVSDGNLDAALALSRPNSVSASEISQLGTLSDLAKAQVVEVWVAKEDACAVTSFFPLKDGSRTAAMGIGLCIDKGRWVVRDLDALPGSEQLATYMKSFRDAFQDARKVLPAAPESNR
jgi:hypothetical protein